MLRPRFVASFALFSLLLAGSPLSAVHAATVVANPGDLIRGTSFSAVYYMGEDGFRYVFPNDKTYFTWYSDFSTVKMLSDKDLATIQMGGNVTYHPGSRMIKINSDPKTYFVSQDGTLQWVKDEATAVRLYGSDWNTKIDDVPDGFFGNYKIGADLSETELEDSASGADLYVSREFGGVNSITDDKDLQEYTTVSIQNMMFGGTGTGASTTTTIQAGHTVRFTNNDAVDHAATADDDEWGTGTLHAGESFVKHFDEPGTYTYHCYYHPTMTGTIIVTAGASD